MINFRDSNRNINNDKQEWEEPMSFSDSNLPLLNTKIFPVWLGEYIENVAEFTQTPVDAPAMASISVLSTILSHKYEVNIIGDWIEPLNIFHVLALGPANRKSAVSSLINYPITNYEHEESKNLERKVSMQELTVKTKKEHIDELRKIHSRENDKNKAEEIFHEMSSLQKESTNEEVAKEIRLLTTDATPEKLAELMFNNEEKISILSSEGAEVFEMMTGRYSNKANLDVYLKAFSGDYIAVDRIGRKSIILEKPLITIGLFVQPSVIEEISSQFQNRGLTQRFLYSLPKSVIGKRKVQPKEIDERAKQKYSLNMNKLLEITSKKTVKLTFSKEASLLEIKLREEIEIMVKDQDISESFQGWIGKLAGQIAGLFHIAEHVTNNIDDIPTEIEKETLEKANELKEYFIEHAKAAHGVMGVNENEKDAKYILNKIKEEDKQEIGVRYMLRKARRIKTAKELKLILSILEEMGYLECMKSGRKEIIKVNPKILNT